MSGVHWQKRTCPLMHYTFFPDITCSKIIMRSMIEVDTRDPLTADLLCYYYMLYDTSRRVASHIISNDKLLTLWRKRTVKQERHTQHSSCMLMRWFYLGYISISKSYIHNSKHHSLGLNTRCRASNCEIIKWLTSSSAQYARWLAILARREMSKACPAY